MAARLAQVCDLGVLQRYLVSPAPRSALVLGKALSAGVRALSQALIVYVLAMLLGVGINLNPLNILGVAVTIDLRPPCPMSGFPAPESFEPCAMPPQDRLRLHHLGQIKQIGPNPRDPYQ
ncbi:MAG: hypothetical protein WB685_09830, partial [Pseudolabrys sp.]